MLVEVERQMDRGEVPWVRVEGTSQRSTVRPEVMESLGLEVGQQITWFLYGEILRLNLEHCQQQLAYERSQKLIAEVETEDEVPRG